MSSQTSGPLARDGGSAGQRWAEAPPVVAARVPAAAPAKSERRVILLRVARSWSCMMLLPLCAFRPSWATTCVANLTGSRSLSHSHLQASPMGRPASLDRRDLVRSGARLLHAGQSLCALVPKFRRPDATGPPARHGSLTTGF